LSPSQCRCIPFARLLIPERREISGTDSFGRRQPIERPIELDCLVRIERVDASAAPPRHVVAEDRRDAIAQVERLHLQAIDDSESEQRPLHERGSIRLRQAPADVLGRHAIVERAVEYELDEALQVQLMRRHAEHDPRRRRRRLANGAGVADSAIQSDLIDPETPSSRDADRQIVSLLDDEAEPLEPGGRFLAADCGKRFEDPVRRQHSSDGSQQRSTRFAADRPVLEMLLDVGVGLRSIGPN
jgi:hypothetical protein